jgi:hypothetical protein
LFLVASARVHSNRSTRHAEPVCLTGSNADEYAEQIGELSTALELPRDAREFNLTALPDEKTVLRYEMHTLPSEIGDRIGTSTLFACIVIDPNNELYNI